MSKFVMLKTADRKVVPIKPSSLVAVSNAIYPAVKPEVKKRPSVLTIAVIAFFVLSLCVLALVAVNTNKVEGKDYTMVKYSVDSGETMWSIVQKVNKDRKYSVREYVNIIKADGRNAEVLKDDVIHSGDVLYIPQTK
jgi:LysM repeat protein